MAKRHSCLYMQQKAVCPPGGLENDHAEILYLSWKVTLKKKANLNGNPIYL